MDYYHHHHQTTILKVGDECPVNHIRLEQRLEN